MRTLLALCVLAVCCACTSANSAPPAAPRTMTGSPVRPSSPPVSNPGGVTVRWVPNLNWKHAHRVVRHGSAALARKLRHDIAAARVFPAGVYACPMDTGVAARLTLRRGDTVEQAVARLTGCATVKVPGQRARFVTDALRRDLATIAPTRWRPYLRS
jgi:hypothetical protein